MNEPGRLMHLTVAACAILCAPAHFASAADPAVVETAFVIEAPKFIEKLGDEEQARVERAVSEKLAELASVQFPYLEWRAIGSGTPSDAAARFTLRLQDIPVSAGEETVLQYSFSIGGSAVDFAWPADRLLYPWHDISKPWRNGPRLEQEVLHRVRERHFGVDAFVAGIGEKFVREVPIAQLAPLVSAAEQKIIVDLPWARLRMKPESVLLIRFDAAQGSEGDSDPAMLRLTLLDERRIAPLAGAVEGSVIYFVFTPVTTGSGVEGWAPEIESVLRAAVRPPSVHMLAYEQERFTGVDGGRATRPE